MAEDIRLVLADVDGTLVTDAKVLTDRARDAIAQLHRAGIGFSLTSGRPARGMEMLVGPLGLTLPYGAFNGGQILSPSSEILEEHVIARDLIDGIVDHLDEAGLDVWFYAGMDWWVPAADGAHVERESATVQFAPKVLRAGTKPSGSIVKIVGVSDDADRISRGIETVRDAFGSQVAADTSQPYYLDITHPDANKGTVVSFLAEHQRLSPDSIATIGDMPNDVEMFQRSGLSIAMGNAEAPVKRAADQVTTSNEAEGFAIAMERFVLQDRH